MKINRLKKNTILCIGLLLLSSFFISCSQDIPEGLLGHWIQITNGNPGPEGPIELTFNEEFVTVLHSEDPFFFEGEYEYNLKKDSIISFFYEETYVDEDGTHTDTYSHKYILISLENRELCLKSTKKHLFQEDEEKIYTFMRR